MRRFRFIDHTGDIGVVVYGRDLRELFVHAAQAFFQIITEPEKIREKKSEEISLDSNGSEELLVAWLNEFLFLFDTRGLLFRRFDLRQVNDNHLEATVWGEGYEQGRHPIKTVIKAVTYHQLEIKQEKGAWKTQIIFDH